MALRQECVIWDVCRNEEVVHGDSSCMKTSQKMRASWKTTEKAGDRAYMIILEGSKRAVLAGNLRCSSMLVRNSGFSFFVLS